MQNNPGESPYLNSITYFRGLAMIIIVAGHSFLISNVPLENQFVMFFKNLLSGSTAYFVFISGYMFHHVYYPKYSYKRFIRSKFLTVFAPYVLISTPFVFSLLKQKLGVSQETETVAYYLTGYLKYMISGSFMIAYWFIPFIMFMFLLAPLHYRYIALSKKTQTAILLVLFVIAGFVHRSDGGLNRAQSLVYFTPLYLFGIYCSIYRTAFLGFMRGKEVYFILVALAITAVQVSMGHLGNYRKPFFEYQGFDLMLIQKILLTVAILSVLERIKLPAKSLLVTISNTSFAIFFLHGFVIFYLDALGIMPFTGLPPVDYVLVIIVNIVICVTVALTLRQVFERKSRYIVGY